jgi:transposase
MRALQRFFHFLLELQGAVIVGAEIVRELGGVLIEVRRRSNSKPHCPRCDRVMGGEWIRKRQFWRHRDLIGRRCYVTCDVREARCPRHGRRIERVPWASPGARHTRSFDRHVACLVQVADKTAATRVFDIAWRTVGRIVRRVVEELLPRDLLDELEEIGIDETSYKRGHRYLTVVSCLVTGRVVWVGDGKTEATLHQFFDVLGKERAARLKVVAMDMSEAYRNAVKSRAPQADIVYDRFHVVKLLLDAVDEIRREECNRLEPEAKKELKGMRFAFLRNPKHRTPKDTEAIRIVQSTNDRLSRTYQLRVDFEDLWELDSEHDARNFITYWTRSALLSRRGPLRRFARTVREKVEGILGFFRHKGITNATAEGMNNKIKLVIHRAFGFHDVSALMAMIHLCCTGIALP